MDGLFALCQLAHDDGARRRDQGAELVEMGFDPLARGWRAPVEADENGLLLAGLRGLGCSRRFALLRMDRNGSRP